MVDPYNEEENEDSNDSGGGDIYVPPILRGCMDPAALNYNPLAELDDGSCVYPLMPINNLVKITINSVPVGTAIYVNGINTNTITPKILEYTQKELLEQKTIKVVQPGWISTVEYRIKTTLGVGEYNTIFEKLIDGAWVIQTIPNIDMLVGSATSFLPITIEFDMLQDIEPDPEVVTPTIEYKVHLVGNVSVDNVIRYSTSNGMVGFITSNTVEDLNVAATASGVPWIKLERYGISSFTHNVTYLLTEPGFKSAQILKDDFTLSLAEGTTTISVSVDKLVTDSLPSTPTITIPNSNLIYNIVDTKPLRIEYSSQYTDKVIYTLGSVQKELSSSGYIEMYGSDFYNGLGTYSIYLQPVSNDAGSGVTKKITINVISKVLTPGPDITHINYPENITGADFVGYAVDFKISWQSINTNYIELYVSKFDSEFALARVAPNDALTLNVADVLTKAGKSLVETVEDITFDLVLVPFNIEGDEVTQGKVETITITFDKGDLRLNRAQVISDIKEAFKVELKKSVLEQETSKYLTHYIHLGNGNNKLISTWEIDNETFSTYNTNTETGKSVKVDTVNTLVLKLYEPLSKDIQPNQQLWISKIQSVSLIDQITILDDSFEYCTILQPNFELDLGDDIGYQIMDDLLANDSISSTELIESYINPNELSLYSLNITYTSDTDYQWVNFVKYSSAEERVENFYYKVKLIEFYNSKYTILSETQGATGSLSVATEMTSILEKINAVKTGFDAFENTLYTEEGELTYPGAGETNVSASDDVASISWYNGAISSATSYDNDNADMLVRNIPQHIEDEPENADFVLFFNMIGQHFDILWNYTKGLSESKKLVHNYDSGITNELIYHMLESLGWDAQMGVKAQVLWEYAFGKNPDGTSSSDMSGKQRQQEIWRRLLNNLPYLYKHKGTKRALHAAMACYGISASMLTIMEFGGPTDTTTDAIVSFTFDDRTAAIEFDGIASVLVPFKEYVNTTDYPNSVEIRLNTEINTDHTILQSGGWDVKILTDTGSLAKIQFNITGSGVVETVETDAFPFFNDEYTQVVVNKTTADGNDVFDIYAKEGFSERIRNEASATLTLAENSTAWKSGSIIEIGTDFIGTVDEFRLWTDPLNESRINNHALLPDAIDGNDVYSSTEDLIFRLDFEYPKDRSATGDVDIKNVSINRFYGETYATASNFTSITDYPFQYIPYERTVTANVPSSGISVSNKIRFESQRLDSYLNYGDSKSNSEYVESTDSNKLGLFFSPTKEINLDILRSLGQFNIDNYIGNPNDEFTDDYSDLSELRDYYFQRFNLNMYEYIQLVKYIDSTLFTTLKSLVPGRAKVSSGLLIEPHILERSKIKRIKPEAEELVHETTISVEEYEEIEFNISSNTANIDAETDIVLDSNTVMYNGTVTIEDEEMIEADAITYTGIIATDEVTSIDGIMTVNENTDMGGISSEIDAIYTGSIIGEYDSSTLTVVGMDPDSIEVSGFGIVGKEGHNIRTYIDVFGTRIQKRDKVYKIKEKYTVDVPENINYNDPSLGVHYISQEFHRYKVTFVEFDNSAPSVSDDIVEVTPLNGYFPSHYRNVGDLTTGLERSYHIGSLQTIETTLDGMDPVQTFITNPNVLRVSDTGRTDAEPILIVE